MRASRADARRRRRSRRTAPIDGVRPDAAPWRRSRAVGWMPGGSATGRWKMLDGAREGQIRIRACAATAPPRRARRGGRMTADAARRLQKARVARVADERELAAARRSRSAPTRDDLHARRRRCSSQSETLRQLRQLHGGLHTRRAAKSATACGRPPQRCAPRRRALAPRSTTRGGSRSSLLVSRSRRAADAPRVTTCHSSLSASRRAASRPPPSSSSASRAGRSPARDRSYFPSVDDDTLRCVLVRAAGDVALRRGRHARRRHHRQGLDAGERLRRAGRVRLRLLEDQHAADALGGRRRRSDSPITDIAELAGKRIATELVELHPALLRRARHRRRGRVLLGRHRGQGRPRAWSTPSSRSPRPAARSAPTASASSTSSVESNPQLIANQHGLGRCRGSARRSSRSRSCSTARCRPRRKVGLKMNVPKERLETIIELLPSITAPTVSPLYGTDWFAVESVIAEAGVRELIPQLLKQGAVGHHRVPAQQGHLRGVRHERRLDCMSSASACWPLGTASASLTAGRLQARRRSRNASARRPRRSAVDDRRRGDRAGAEGRSGASVNEVQQQPDGDQRVPGRDQRQARLGDDQRHPGLPAHRRT